MQESPQMQDPASGYASADALGPDADVNQHRPAGSGPDTTQNPASGYASADVLDALRD